MFRRKWFFWIDRLKVTRAERVSILGLMTASICLSLALGFYDPQPPYDDEDYRELDQFFEKRLQAMKQEEARIIARYKGDKRSTSSSGKNSGNRSDKRDSRPIRLHINKADIDALQTLPGIGPALAERIISYREREGPFKRTGDLVNVKGIGSATLENMRPFLRQLPDH